MDRKIKKKKFTPKRISGVLLAGGFLSFGFYQFVLGDYSTKLNVKKERLTISTVRQGPFQEYIPVIGTVIPKKSIYHDTRFRKHQIKQIEASLKRMDANLKIAKQKLADLTLKAPVTGHLTSLNAEIGESKKQGERLGQIDILDGFKVRVAVDEHYLARINTGQHGEFTFDEKTYQLTISKIYPEVKDGRFEIDMMFEGVQPKGITRGQALHIRLELGNLSTAVLLPQGGFYQKTGGQWVYLIDDTGEFAIKQTINLGRQNPEVFEVLSGLQRGERVITSSYDNYGDNIDKLILK
jgi:HlyD family secretion protein